VPDFAIEGNPANIRAKALTMEQKGQLFYDTGDALGKIDVSGWTGRAADEFREAHDLEPDRWIKSGNGFKKAAAGLRTYAGELESAQSRAEAARKEYERGQQESESARTQYSSYMDRMRTYWSGGGTDQAQPFVDWGDPIQQEALGELNAARADLDSAAHVCAGEVKAGCADAPEEPNWL
jgi:exonuclease VII small subunit